MKRKNLYKQQPCKLKKDAFITETLDPVASK